MTSTLTGTAAAVFIVPQAVTLARVAEPGGAPPELPHPAAAAVTSAASQSNLPILARAKRRAPPYERPGGHMVSSPGHNHASCVVPSLRRAPRCSPRKPHPPT